MKRGCFSCDSSYTNDAAWLQYESTCFTSAYPRDYTISSATRDSGTCAISYSRRDSDACADAYPYPYTNPGACAHAYPYTTAGACAHYIAKRA